MTVGRDARATVSLRPSAPPLPPAPRRSARSALRAACVAAGALALVLLLACLALPRPAGIARGLADAAIAAAMGATLLGRLPASTEDAS